MKRASGVLAHISSLPGEYGIGSFGKEAKEFVDFLHDCGFSYWQTLPFCAPDKNNSPYKTSSAFSVNANFIDLPSLNAAGLITDRELEEQRQTSPYLCEFDVLAKKRPPLLAKAAERAYGDPDLSIEKFIRHTFYTQWANVKNYANSRGVKIIGDVPFYVDLDSADVAQNRNLFQLDEDGFPAAVAGVPPDGFSQEGQKWGNPLYDWDEMRKDGFAWWKRRLNRTLELFDGARLDHFRGFEAYYAVPANGAARDGAWKEGPGKEIIDAIKSVVGDKLIIAEDLGVITDGVKALLEYSGFPGTRVLQFAFTGDPDSPHLPHNYVKSCVAYTGTHDNDTLLGYVYRLDRQTRKRLFDYCGYYGDTIEEGCEYVLRTMFASSAGLLMLPIQDLLLYGEDTRMNVPGTTSGNWGYRFTRSQLETIDKSKFKRLNELYGRI